MEDRIITLPHASLRQRSKKVGLVDDTIKQIISDMKQATLDWEETRAHEVSVALAAVQIDVLYRIIILRNNFDNKQDKTFHVFINPEITKYEGKLVEDYEGCLSVRDIYGKVPRHDRVRIKALNERGAEVRLTADGFLARVFQHEIDHTNGIVFIDRIRELPDAFYRLTDEGKLLKLDYDKVVKDDTELWGEDTVD